MLSVFSAIHVLVNGDSSTLLAAQKRLCMIVKTVWEGAMEAACLGSLILPQDIALAAEAGAACATAFLDELVQLEGHL